MIGRYCRFSTDKQDRGLSIERQVALCDAFIAREGLQGELRTYADRGFTGRNFERPGFQRLLKDIDAKLVRVVVVAAWDRLGRTEGQSFSWIERLEGEGVSVFSATEGNDPTARGFSLVSAADSSRKLSVRTKAAKLEHAKVGHWMGASPFGYRLALLSDGHKGLEIVPEKASIPLRVWTLYADGLGYARIAQGLNGEGIPSPTGKKWTDSMIRRILNNPVYLGALSYNKGEVVVPAPHLRMIPEELERRVNARRADVAEGYRSNGLKGTRRPRYMLSGKLTCGDCDNVMLVRPRRSGVRAYRCKTRMLDPTACENRLYVPMLELEGKIVAGIEERLWSEENISAATDAAWETIRSSAQEQALRQSRLNDIGCRLGRLVRRLEESDTEPHTIVDRIAELERQKAKLASLLPQLMMSRADVGRAVRARIGQTRQILDRLSSAKVPIPPAYFSACRSLLESVEVFSDGSVGVRARLSAVDFVDRSGSQPVNHAHLPVVEFNFLLGKKRAG